MPSVEIPSTSLLTNSGSGWNGGSADPSVSLSYHSSDSTLAARDEIAGTSRQIRAIKQCVDRIAATEATVLITGETGTGKELFARRLHQLSHRREGPFVAINCASIPDNLVESELFGFEKGTFTGAVARQEGRLLHANGGTLFLDEIGDLSPSAQAKLLRVLEDKRIQPLGSRTGRILDARVVAATNHNLQELGAAGKFRPDLFFRLSVITVHIPPLRERKEDIPLIAAHMLRNLCLQYGRAFVDLTSGARDYLKQRTWKGNARELRNLMERVLLLCGSDRITEQQIALFSDSSTCSQFPMSMPGAISSHREVGVARSTIRANTKSRKVASSACSELNELRNALQQTKWNKTKTAEVLQWSRMTIYRKIVQYDLHPPEEAVTPEESANLDERTASAVA